MAAVFQGVELYQSLQDLSTRDRAWCDTNATLIYSGTLEAFDDTGLTGSTQYYYKIFAKYLDDLITTYSSGVMISKTTEEVTFGEYELLADIIVSNTTSNVDITGLNIDKDDHILLVVSAVNGASPESLLLRWFVNGNYTQTDYWTQRISADGNVVSSVVANSTVLLTDMWYHPTSMANARIKLTNSGNVVVQSETLRGIGQSTVLLYDSHGSSIFTVSAITMLTIRSDFTNGIGAGSRFQLYRTGGA